MIIILIAVWPQFLEMWETQDFFGVPGVFTAPWWPVKLVICLSAGLCALHFLLHVISKPPSPDEQIGLGARFGGDNSIEDAVEDRH